MDHQAMERIDAAIAALQSVPPDKAPHAERIIARLMAARRGLCADPSTCSVCPVPCNRQARWSALSEAAGRAGDHQPSTATT